MQGMVRNKWIETRQQPGQPSTQMSLTLSMFYKGQSIWDGRQNLEKNKGQDLALSHIARDIF